MDAVDLDLAGVVDEAADRLEQGALSRAVWTDHADQLASADRERDVVEHDLVAVVDSKLDDFENGMSSGHASNHIKNEIDSQYRNPARSVILVM